MQRSERQRMIIRAISRGERSVEDLAELTGVSAITVRRDLVELAEQGALTRTRGGAAPATARGIDYPFELRKGERLSAKQHLAVRVAEMIPAGSSVLIDNGTTALAVAEQLAGKGVTAMALSMHAAAALARTPDNQVIVPGGLVDSDDLSFSGAGAAEAVRDMRFDYAVIGACAADPETGLTVARWGDAQVKRAVLSVSRHVLLAVTAEKFSRSSAHRFGDFRSVDTVVTTTGVPASVTAALTIEGVDLITVQSKGDAEA